jgi:hypothetical protein
MMGHQECRIGPASAAAGGALTCLSRGQSENNILKYIWMHPGLYTEDHKEGKEDGTG